MKEPLKSFLTDLIAVLLAVIIPGTVLLGILIFAAPSPVFLR